MKKEIKKKVEELKEKLCTELLCIRISGKEESGCDRIPQAEILFQIDRIFID